MNLKLVSRYSPTFVGDAPHLPRPIKTVNPTPTQYANICFGSHDDIPQVIKENRIGMIIKDPRYMGIGPFPTIAPSRLSFKVNGMPKNKTISGWMTKNAPATSPIIQATPSRMMFIGVFFFSLTSPVTCPCLLLASEAAPQPKCQKSRRDRDYRSTGSLGFILLGVIALFLERP